MVTLMPGMYSALTEYGVVTRAFVKNPCSFWDPRTYTSDVHKTVDDRPYGGGKGMVLKPEPVVAAIRAAKAAAPVRPLVIYMTPAGQPLTQAVVEELSKAPALLFLAGRYEGIDERVVTLEVDRQYSLGDYVVSSGDLPVMVTMDAIARLMPGVLSEGSSELESFATGLRLEHPQYTRPAVFEGLEVPAVLQSGHHAEIEKYQAQQAIGRTFEKRPDCIEKQPLTEQERKRLVEYQQACLDIKN